MPDKIDRLIKSLYDAEYRIRNADRIKRRKQAYNKRPAGRAYQKRQREKNKSKHSEYIRHPVYKHWKSEYDFAYRAKVYYGPFWEVMGLVVQIQKKVCQIVPDQYQRNRMRGIVAKWGAYQKAKRRLMAGMSA